MTAPTALPDTAQMIDGESKFFLTEAEKFTGELKKHTNASSCYTVISIIGPQCSGKSYLLNELFGTKFDVLPQKTGWHQTTKGIWIAKCINPCMIIMDVEGFDGKERGEEDGIFERRSALFALTVSDVLLLNMWFNDIGRQQAANHALIRLIFEVRVKIEAPKTTVIIVVRDCDYDQNPADIINKTLHSLMNELWDAVHRDASNRKIMSDYIEVIVKDFPHKKEKQEFVQKSKDLAKLLCGFAEGSTGKNQCASSFAISSKETWDLICSDKRVIAANIKLAMSAYVCNEIMNEMLNSLDQEEGCKSLMCGASPVKNFVAELLSFIQTTLAKYVARYEEETGAFDRNIRAEKKDLLMNKIIARFEETFKTNVESLCKEMLSKAESNLPEQLKESALNEVIRTYITEFDANFGEDLPRTYKEALNKCRQKFEDDLRRKAIDEIKALEETFKNKVESLCEEMLSKAKSNLRQQLDRSAQNEVIRTYITEFDANFGEDSPPKYKEVLNKACRKFEDDLTAKANDVIQAKSQFKKGLMIGGGIALAASGMVALGPTATAMAPHVAAAVEGTVATAAGPATAAITRKFFMAAVTGAAAGVAAIMGTGRVAGSS